MKLEIHRHNKPPERIDSANWGLAPDMAQQLKDIERDLQSIRSHCPALLDYFQMRGGKLILATDQESYDQLTKGSKSAAISITQLDGNKTTDTIVLNANHYQREDYQNLLAHEMAHAMDCRYEIPGLHEGYEQKPCIRSGVLSANPLFAVCLQTSLNLFPNSEISSFIRNHLISVDYPQSERVSESFAAAMGAYCKHPTFVDEPVLKTYIETVTIPYMKAIAQENQPVCTMLDLWLRRMHYGKIVGEELRHEFGDWQEAKTPEARKSTADALMPRRNELARRITHYTKTETAKEMDRIEGILHTQVT